MYQTFIKRTLDLILSSIAFLLLMPIFVVTTIILAIVNHGKAFYFQDRPGFKGKIFYVIKFKTMNDKKDVNGNLLPSMDRITPIGKFIRKYSLDEIPQLLNVMKGDMSIVGPRPLLVQYLELYTEEQKKRHNVKPGITGWAQINGRNSITWREKFEFDLYYVKNISFKLDLIIFLKTIFKVIKGSDINLSENKTVETFNGRN